MRSIVRCLFAGFLAALLAGCASTGFKLDNEVRSFSGLTAMPAPASYRFERLPSQNADPYQGGLEALADPALHKAGFRRDDAAPRYSVQVSARLGPARRLPAHGHALVPARREPGGARDRVEQGGLRKPCIECRAVAG
jgi:hypothetical protein